MITLSFGGKMVSLDDAVLARMEKAGKRFEILVDPDLVEKWKLDPSSVELDDLLAMDEVFHDARGGERVPDELKIEIFGSTDINEIIKIIFDKGSIQLTTSQRKARVEMMRQKIIHAIHSDAIDPRSKTPHPRTRIELALEESRYSVDPFKPVDKQIEEAINKLRPLIPLSFELLQLAFKIPSSGYGKASQILRKYQRKEEWLSDGSWVCIAELPAGRKGDLITSVMKVSSDAEVRDL